MMFDTIHIHGNFLPKVKELDYNGYKLNNLQTKSFDGLLEEYYVGEDGVLLLDKVDYVLLENTEYQKKTKCSPPFFQEEKSRIKVVYPYTGIITAGAFFMNYHNSKDEIFIDIDFNFVNGTVKDIGIIKKLEITPYEKILEKRKQIEEKRRKKDSDIKYQVFKYLSRFINKILLKLSKIQFCLNSYQPK